MHQGSGLSPLLFAIIMETISREFRFGLHLELLYADDLMAIVDSCMRFVCCCLFIVRPS